MHHHGIGFVIYRMELALKKINLNILNNKINKLVQEFKSYEQSIFERERWPRPAHQEF